MINRILITFFVSTFLISTSCVKKEKEYPTYYLGQDYKDHVVYKPGSYWIYEEGATKKIDSVYLYKQDFSINPATSKINYNYEGISENKTSSLYGTLTFGGFTLRENGDAEYKEIILGDYVISNVNYFEGEIGQSALETYNTLYTEKKDSIEYNGQTFFAVKVFENTKQMYSLQPQKTYYAKHVGLVRKELFNGEVWNLIRYKVSQ